MACKDVPGDMMEDVIEIPENAAFKSRQAKMSNELRIGDELTDFTIISEGQTFRCHSNVLASSSDIFLAMFRAAMKESTKRQMELPIVPPNVVKVILEYIYLRTMKVPSHLLLDTIKAAHYLHLHELTQDCLHRALQVLKPSNVISWHHLAHELEIKELKQECSDFMAKSLVEIAESSEFRNMSQADLISCLSDMKDADIDEDDKLKAVIAWMLDDLGSQSKDMPAIIKYIDVSQCSVKCIDEIIKKHSDLLDKEMCLMFAQSLVTIAAEETVRRNQQERKKMMAVIAGQKKICWRVDESMTVTLLCKDLECTAWYSACEVPQGFVLIGGVLCMMYVIPSLSWVKLAPMQSYRDRHASIYMNRKVFVFAGLGSKSVQSLRLDGDEWVDEPDLPTPMTHPEVAIIDRTIFLLDVETNQLLCLDKTRKTWVNKAKCPGQIGAGPRMISVRGQLLVAGGAHQLCALYTPGTNTWITCNPPRLKHHLGALICHNDKIYLIGGSTTPDVEEYDLDRNLWSWGKWRLPCEVQHLQAVRVDAC